MFDKAFKRLATATTSLATVCIVAVPAAAQSGPSYPSEQSERTQAEPGIQDIVVTAQRRSERLQDVPIAVTAVSGDDLLARGLNSATDLNMATPNLNVNRTVKTQIVYLRGVGNNSASPGQEQNVAIYVDGVYYPSMAANVFSFNNVERIEVLRGPQGTLFGRNTTGGLIQVVTKDPTDDLSGDFQAGYGNFDTYMASAYISGGVTDTLRADFALQYSNQRDGWGKNLVTGSDVYRGRDLNLRSKIVFEPNDMTKFTLSGIYFNAKSDFTSRTVQPCAPRLGGLDCVPIPSDIPGFGNLPYTGFYNTQSGLDIFERTRLRTLSLRYDQDIGFARLVNTSAYQKTKSYLQLDGDGVPAYQRISLWTDITESFSNEVQLLSPEGSSFDWIAGVFFFWSKAGSQPLQQTTPTTSQSIFSSTSTHSFSGFAQVGIPLGENTRLTAGARYTIDKKSLTARIVNDVSGVTTNYPTRRETFSDPTFKVSLDHHLSPDALLYASISTGFKSGLYNTSSPTAPPVDPEKITSYELGAKLDLFDRRFRLNTAFFYYDYRDLQLIGYDGRTTFLQNASNAEIYGAEADFNAVLTDQFSFRGSAGYTHGRYTDFPGAQSNSNVNPVTGVTTSIPAGLDASGNHLGRTPTFTGNVGFDYSVPVSFGAVDLSGTFYHNSGFAWDVDNRLKEKAYQLLNMSATWTSKDEAFNVRLWADNILGTKYCAAQQSGNATLDQCSAAAPRTYGVVFGFKF